MTFFPKPQSQSPAGFPSSIPIDKGAYKNWSREINVDNIWVCTPRDVQDVLTVMNWAKTNDFKVKALGKMHNWSPINLLVNKDAIQRIIYMDTTKNLKKASVNTAKTPAVLTAETGIFMDDVSDLLRKHGYGFGSMPAPGDITLGGLLAINGHGTGIPVAGEVRQPGQVYGSLSNAVLSITAVVWDDAANRYVLKTFERTNPECAVLLTNLGRIFITEVKMQVMKDQRMLCESYFDLTIDRLCNSGADYKNSLQQFLNKSGRIELIWFPFTETPWLKVWTVQPKKPFLVRQVSKPYNYPVTDHLPSQISDIVKRIMNGETNLAPLWGKTQHQLASSSVKLGLAEKIWGWSKDVLHYIREDTLRVTANGYAIITNHNNIFEVVRKIINQHKKMLAAYEAKNQYPINGPVEIRITGLDKTSDVDLPGAVEPAYSAIKPRHDHPEWDVAIWVDMLTMPGTPHASEFYAELEEWTYANFNNGRDSAMRVEWSKGWGYTAQGGAWSSDKVIDQRIPDSFQAGSAEANVWQANYNKMMAFDPHRICETVFLDRLLKK